MQCDCCFAAGQLISAKGYFSANEEEITIFDSTGLAIQEVAAGGMVYERALNANKGIRLRLM